MTTPKKSFERLGLFTGLVTGAVLVVYFMLMRAFNLVHIPELRYFNFVILFGGLLFAYLRYRRSHENIPYLPGLGLGIVTTVASMVPFAAFVFIYFNDIEPDLLEKMNSHSATAFADYITPLAMSGAIVIEGMCAGLILSFILMQYFKSRTKKVSHELS